MPPPPDNTTDEMNWLVIMLLVLAGAGIVGLAVYFGLR